MPSQHMTWHASSLKTVFLGMPQWWIWTAATPPSRPHPASPKRAIISAGGPSMRRLFLYDGQALFLFAPG